MSAHQWRWQRIVERCRGLVHTRRPDRAPLRVEQLEDKCLPSAVALPAALPYPPAPLAAPAPAEAQGVFFTDGLHQVWMWSSATQQFTNTGGYALQIAGGVDAQGNPEVFFTDGNSQLWRWDNGTFTNTGAYALQLGAGRGMAAFIDGNGELWTFSDAAGFLATGRTIPIYFVSSAFNFSIGWDAAGNNLVAFVDKAGQLWTLTPGSNTMTNTGAFALTLGVGRDAQGFNQVYFDDGNGLLYRYDQGQFVNTGVSVKPYYILGSQAGFYFSSYTDGLDGFGYTTLFNEGYSDSQNAFTFLGSSESPLRLTNALAASPGTSDAFLTDGNNQIWLFQNGAASPINGFALQVSAF